MRVYVDDGGYRLDGVAGLLSFDAVVAACEAQPEGCVELVYMAGARLKECEEIEAYLGARGRCWKAIIDPESSGAGLGGAFPAVAIGLLLFIGVALWAASE